MICGGPHGNLVLPLLHTLRKDSSCCFGNAGIQFLVLLSHYYYSIKNSWKRPRNQNRVTFALIIRPDKSERNGFISSRTMQQTNQSCPKFRHHHRLYHPLDVLNNQDQPKPRLLAPNTPPPKSFRNKRQTADAVLQETHPQQVVDKRQQQHRLIHHHHHWIVDLWYCINIKLPPSCLVRYVPCQYRRLHSRFNIKSNNNDGGRKRRHDDDDEEPMTQETTHSTQGSYSQSKSGRFPLKHKQHVQRRISASSLESTEAWLLEEFNRKRPEKKQATETNNTTSATQSSSSTPAQGETTPASSDSLKPAFTFGGANAILQQATQRMESQKQVSHLVQHLQQQQLRIPQQHHQLVVLLRLLLLLKRHRPQGGGGFTFGQSEST